MARRYSFTLLVAVALMLTACGSRGSRGSRLTQEDNGGQLQVNAGEQFAIELPANPSTGYTWEPQDLDAAMFEMVGEPEYEAVGEVMPGSGGNLTLTFKALQPGTATLTLVYHRSWETDVDPADTFAVTVTVK